MVKTRKRYSTMRKIFSFSAKTHNKEKSNIGFHEKKHFPVALVDNACSNGSTHQ